MSVKKAAEWAGVSPGFVYGWFETGLLPHYRLGAKGRRGKIAIAEVDLEAFVEAHKVQGQPPATPAPVRTAKQKSTFRHISV